VRATCVTSRHWLRCAVLCCAVFVTRHAMQRHPLRGTLKPHCSHTHTHTRTHARQLMRVETSGASMQRFIGIHVPADHGMLPDMLDTIAGAFRRAVPRARLAVPRTASRPGACGAACALCSHRSIHLPRPPRRLPVSPSRSLPLRPRVSALPTPCAPTRRQAHLA
jgi:hypothetical protein